MVFPLLLDMSGMRAFVQMSCGGAGVSYFIKHTCFIYGLMIIIMIINSDNNAVYHRVFAYCCAIIDRWIQILTGMINTHQMQHEW